MTLRIAAIALLVALFVGLAIFGPRACSKAQREAGEQKAATARAEGQIKAATDATTITADTLTNATAADDQTRANEDAIRKSGGDPDVWLRAMCVRPSYQHLPRCVALQRSGAGATGG